MLRQADRQSVIVFDGFHVLVLLFEQDEAGAKECVDEWELTNPAGGNFQVLLCYVIYVMLCSVMSAALS